MSTKIETLIKRMYNWIPHSRISMWNTDNTVVIDYGFVDFSEDIIMPYEVGKITDNMITIVNNHRNADYSIEMDLPSLKELKSELKSLVGNNRTKLVTYDFSDSGDLPRVNARFLIQLVEGLNATKIYCTKENPKKSCIKVCGTLGTAYLLPVNYYGTDSKGMKVVSDRFIR